MKLGIIGSGVIVQEFLPKLIKLEGMEVKGIQGVIEQKEQVEKLCEENKVPAAVFEFEDLIKLDIDTVYVAVPNHLHYMYCRKAIEAGMNVIVEKPLTSNIEEAEILRALSEEHKVFLFEAVTTVYFESFQKIREWIGKIGDVKLVQCNYSQYSRRYDMFKDGIIQPAFDPKKSGGALMDLNLYNLHFVMELFGLPQSAKYYANIEKNIDTSGTVILRYPKFIAICTAAKDCSAPYNYVIEGTKGYITTQYPPNLIGEIRLHMNDGKEEKFSDGMASERLIPEFEYFIDCINKCDYDSCKNRLKKSIDVSKIQTQVRRAAGVIFEADRESL